MVELAALEHSILQNVRGYPCHTTGIQNVATEPMGALHSRDQGRTKLMIRETLTNLRDIVNNASRPDMSFEEMLADLRLQISEHLHAAGVEIDWRAESTGEAVLPLQAAHTLRSIARETVPNALKHAGASKIAVTVRLEIRESGEHIADEAAAAGDEHDEEDQ